MCITCHIIDNAIFIALEAAASDEGFKLPTAKANSALLLTTKLIELSKMSERRVELCSWSNVIVAKLKECIPAPMTNKTTLAESDSPCHNTLTKIKREKMWSNFHKLICSSSFRDM